MARKMTRPQALLRAKELWGEWGSVNKRRNLFYVGLEARVGSGFTLVYHGRGQSWEAAFEDAKNRGY